MTTYAISPADRHEKADMKKVQAVSWIATPNSHDELDHCRIATHPRAAELFTGREVLRQLASRMAPTRWVLANQRGPLSYEDMAMMTRFPRELFEFAVPELHRMAFLIAVDEQITHEIDDGDGEDFCPAFMRVWRALPRDARRRIDRCHDAWTGSAIMRYFEGEMLFELQHSPRKGETAYEFFARWDLDEGYDGRSVYPDPPESELFKSIAVKFEKLFGKLENLDRIRSWRIWRAKERDADPDGMRERWSYVEDQVKRYRERKPNAPAKDGFLTNEVTMQKWLIGHL